MPHPPLERELREAIREVNFTPAVREAPALFDLLAGDDAETVRDAERALLRMGRPAARLAMARGASARPPLRARLCRLVGMLAKGGDEELFRFLLTRLEDEDRKTRRNAMIALGHLRRPEAEKALIDAWPREEGIDHRRTLAAALGKIGSRASLDLLEGISTGDPELSRIVSRAVLMLRRTLLRDGAGGIALDRVPERPLDVLLRCRAGLAELLAEECGEDLSPRVLGPDRVRVRLREAPERLLRARTLLSFGFPLKALPTGGEADVALHIARALAGDEARRILSTFTDGEVRFRLSFSSGGPRRALVWRCAQAVARAAPELRNDPTESPWEVVVHERRGFLDVELCPRRYHDPRFSYRKHDVPAASHPTMAAALARIAGVRAEDAVWDPFAGSGLELVERALLGPYRSLCGSDLDEDALRKAGENFTAAGLSGATLVLADARAYVPEQPPTLILTNPPMGRRLLRGDDLRAFFARFLHHAGRVLAPGGRLVWISPLPEATVEQARRAGLRPGVRRAVDMGGFRGEIQVFGKRS